VHKSKEINITECKNDENDEGVSLIEKGHKPIEENQSSQIKKVTKLSSKFVQYLSYTLQESPIHNESGQK
jgi:hypothetical protein